MKLREQCNNKKRPKNRAFYFHLLTACVTGKWAGWDNAGSRKKTEARKMLENPAESQLSGAPKKSGGLIFHARNRPVERSILPSDRSTSRTQQWRFAEQAAPRCTVVTGPIDLYTGGEGGKDPDDAEALIPLNDRVLSIIKSRSKR